MALVAAFEAWDEPTTSERGAQLFAWDMAREQRLGLARRWLFPEDISAFARGQHRPDLREEREALRGCIADGEGMGLVHEHLELVEERFELIRREIGKYMMHLENGTDDWFELMGKMFDRLAQWQRVWGVPLRVYDQPRVMSAYSSLFHSLLHASLPASFPDWMHRYLAHSLSHASASFSSLPGPGDSTPIPSASAAGPPQTPHPYAPSAQLNRLGFLTRYGATVMRVAFGEIERLAKEEAEKGWEEKRLGEARRRMGENVGRWVEGMYAEDARAKPALKALMPRLEYHLAKVFFDIRVDELFDIIVDYPDSLAALEDLKECLFRVDQRGALVDKLKEANVKRLLHPGADTKDVITQYISLIRCLRILDPPGVLLHKVAEPIRQHLRSRPDTIRCIVEKLVKGEELDLADQPEDTHRAPALSSSVALKAGEEEPEDWMDPKWEPEPVDAAPEFRSGRPSDIVSTLVSIYETRDVIFAELQALLAQSLLGLTDYDAVREIRTVELLKIRFGEAALQVCDVMLKDVADSKRIDDRIQNDVRSSVHPLVISRMFWPSVGTSSLHLSARLERMQQEYATAFHQFKPDKHLRFLQHLGTARIKLELEDRVVEVDATPVQASVAEVIAEDSPTGTGSWTVDAIADTLNVDAGSVKIALGWWRDQGVVREGVGAHWEIVERLG